MGRAHELKPFNEPVLGSARTLASNFQEDTSILSTLSPEQFPGGHVYTLVNNKPGLIFFVDFWNIVFFSEERLGLSGKEQEW
jgi:hypothetical protein